MQVASVIKNKIPCHLKSTFEWQDIFYLIAKANRLLIVHFKFSVYCLLFSVSFSTGRSLSSFALLTVTTRITIDITGQVLVYLSATISLVSGIEYFIKNRYFVLEGANDK